MSFSQLYSKIFKKSIFEILPDLKEFAFTEGQVKVIAANTTILSTGEVPTELIIPIDAELKMENDKAVTFLKAGRSVSLQNLLFQTPADFTFSSLEKTKVFSLPFEALEKYLTNHPTEKKYLLNITSCPACRSLKKYFEERNIPMRLIIQIISSIKEATADEVISRFSQDIILVSKGEVLLKLEDQSYVLNDRITTSQFLGNSFLTNSSKKVFSIDTLKGDFKVLPIEKIISSLEKNFDFDLLIYEPFLKLEIAKLQFDFSEFETNTQLPGKSVSKEEIIPSLDKDFPFHKVLAVSNDFETISASIFHALLYFNRPASLDNIKASVIFNGYKLSASAIGDIFYEYGVEAVHVKLTSSTLDEFRSPFLFFSGNKFSFCLSRSGDDFVVLDPIDGFKIFKKNDFDHLNWTGEVTILRPNLFYHFKSESASKIKDSNEDLTDFKVKSITKIIFQMVTEDKKFIFKVMLCSLLVFGIDIWVPKVSEYLLDEVLKTSDTTTLLSLVVLMVILYTASVLLTFFRTFFINSWGISFNDRFTSSIISVIFSKKTFSGKKVKIGDIMQRFGEIDEVRTFFGPEKNRVS